MQDNLYIYTVMLDPPGCWEYGVSPPEIRILAENEAQVFKKVEEWINGTGFEFSKHNGMFRIVIKSYEVPQPLSSGVSRHNHLPMDGIPKRRPSRKTKRRTTRASSLALSNFRKSQGEIK